MGWVESLYCWDVHVAQCYDLSGDFAVQSCICVAQPLAVPSSVNAVIQASMVVNKGDAHCIMIPRLFRNEQLGWLYIWIWSACSYSLANRKFIIDTIISNVAFIITNKSPCKEEPFLSLQKHFPFDCTNTLYIETTEYTKYWKTYRPQLNTPHDMLQSQE